MNRGRHKKKPKVRPLTIEDINNAIHDMEYASNILHNVGFTPAHVIGVTDNYWETLHQLVKRRKQLENN